MAEDDKTKAACEQRFKSIEKTASETRDDIKELYTLMNKMNQTLARIDARQQTEEKYSNLFRGASFKIAVAIVGAGGSIAVAGYLAFGKAVGVLEQLQELLRKLL